MTTTPETRRARGQRHLRQFLTFGMVGGSGVIVNLAVTVVGKWIVPHYEQVAWPLPGTRYNVRWYHLIASCAFLIANTWNYELNRRVTFKDRGRGRASWWRGLANFMGIGAAAFLVGLVIQTWLLNRNSPIWLGQISWLDDANGFRTKLYWASMIQIVLTMPINFIVNKLWTFRAVRHHQPGDPLPLLAPVVDPDEVTEAGTIVGEPRHAEG
ncbi:MAG TPA: GtrA family protein [Candidatus Luteococcus avicola]|nr:GtrA family protein [Candidatus Luteococcus avicola]